MIRHGDLAAVGNEYFGKHGFLGRGRKMPLDRYIRKTPKPYLSSRMGAFRAADMAHAHDIPGFGRVDDAVVPQVGGAVVGVALLLGRGDDGIL
jgi:hypothetical protein